jgi:hypothetical protein
MTVGLPVSFLIQVGLSLTPTGAQAPNLSSLLILGDSEAIDTKERLRSYSALSAVATDFGTTAPEYLAALLYFSQTPQPTSLYIGRWAKNATHGRLVCGDLSVAQQAIGLWQAVTNGGFKIAVDGGAVVEVDSLNFSAATNLNAVAADISAALVAATVGATCFWDGGEFNFKSNSTGASSAVAALTSPTAGGVVDISGQLMGTTATLAYTVQGIIAESAVAAVALFDTALPTQFYGLTFAAGAGNVDIGDSDHLAIAAYIEAASNKHLYGVTTGETAAQSSPDTTSIGYLLKQAGYNRTFVHWSSTNPFAVAGDFGQLLTVNFAGVDTTLTLAYQNIAGLTPEVLTSAQAAALTANNYNVFATMQNGINVMLNGACASGVFIDTQQGADWLASQMQTDVFNLLATVGTKVPQDDAGMHLIGTVIEATCNQGVANGFLGPGTWTAGGFGQLVTGQFLPTGYYIFVPPLSSQPQPQRSARQSVPIQIAAKTAGAVQDVNISISVNP